jgi:cytochrome c oxidase assembly protein subunit 15
MAVIGAITRLTESGLSITEWKPITGAIPPLHDADWEKAWALYKQTPQFAAIHAGMDLNEFKGIYFWEWLHRLWGRLIGVVYALPLLFFWVTKKIPQGFKAPLLIGFALGGAQGFVGWVMVKSGLEPGMAAVSPVRLAVHLGFALFIYGFLLWQILRLKAESLPALSLHKTMRLHAFLGLFLLCATLFWGALTAGLDAGKIYNSFPLMNGALIPPDFLALQPAAKNIIANPAAVQFMHRWLAVLTSLTLIFLSVRLMRLTEMGFAKKLGMVLLGTVSVQIALGIATLLLNVPLVLAVLHQANAILLLSTVIPALFILKRKKL